MLLTGQTAVITGCARGIGKSILDAFASAGCNVWACVRAQSDEFDAHCRHLSETYQVQVTPLYFDLRREDEIKAAMKTLFSSKQKIDVLVNNAGVTSPNALFQMTSLDQMREVFEINFFAQMLVTQYVSRLMAKHQSGSIINVASIAGIDGNPGQLEYVASKAALIGATKKLAEELSVHNIRVNALAPGLVETDMIGRMADEVLEATLRQTTLKRLGQPHEIAKAALFLASDLSSFMTGQVMRVDGGH